MHAATRGFSATAKLSLVFVLPKQRWRHEAFTQLSASLVNVRMQSVMFAL